MLLPLLFAAAALTPGAVAEKVVCAGAPDKSYALYVPSSYRPDRKWPIVFALDARADAMKPMAAFREGAEKYGYVIASSWDSSSDGPMQPTVDAVRAMWSDVHARLSIDDKRIYIAGFSGTARIACAMALGVPGSVTGVIGASAGFPPGEKPAKTTSFVFFGTTGTRDFNFDEMQELEDDLTHESVPHRIRVFDGTHEWMPPALATEALGWLTLRAMQSRTIPRDATLLEALWTADFERGRALEAAGSLVDADRMYRSMIHDYAGLRETGDAISSVQRLNASKDLDHQQQILVNQRLSDARYLARAQQILAAPKLLPVAQLAAELQLRDLDHRTRSSDAVERFSAIRVQNTLVVQTAYYMPHAAQEKGDLARAAAYLELASRIRPEDARIRYELAAAQARNGNRAAALDALHEAVRLGFHDRAAVEKDFGAMKGEALAIVP